MKRDALIIAGRGLLDRLSRLKVRVICTKVNEMEMETVLVNQVLSKHSGRGSLSVRQVQWLI